MKLRWIRHDKQPKLVFEGKDRSTGQVSAMSNCEEVIQLYTRGESYNYAGGGMLTNWIEGGGMCKVRGDELVITWWGDTRTAWG